ncbi:hypothetical protein [Halorussus sp. AFM4]|uniref:hypothetical protein n=1 Tax=Halorussus sp. AFM4 TaxID=3421651 RepID=UPI003EBFAEF8
MSEDERDTFQLRFKDGGLVEQPAESKVDDDDPAAESIEPGEETGFVVEAKSGALDVNGNLVETVETHGRTLEFGSREHAENYARQLSASGGGLRIQAAPENDPSDVDAYLLADHNPSIKEPATVEGDTWTFDVGANLYGVLGEAILVESPKAHALHYFVRQDLDDVKLEEKLNVDVQPGRLISMSDDLGENQKNWIPDCKIIAKDGWDGPVVERYYCEIKTGNASFERTQVAAMEQLARDERVLKIRMLIEELPDQYSLRIHEVEPPD